MQQKEPSTDAAYKEAKRSEAKGKDREERRGDCFGRIIGDVSLSAYRSEFVTALESSFLW